MLESATKFSNLKINLLYTLFKQNNARLCQYYQNQRQNVFIQFTRVNYKHMLLTEADLIR